MLAKGRGNGRGRTGAIAGSSSSGGGGGDGGDGGGSSDSSSSSNNYRNEPGLIDAAQ